MDYRTLVIGALVTASVPIVEALARFDPSTIADWRVWATGIAAGCVRQVGVYFLAKLIENGTLPQPKTS